MPFDERIYMGMGSVHPEAIEGEQRLKYKLGGREAWQFLARKGKGQKGDHEVPEYLRNRTYEPPARYEPDLQLGRPEAEWGRVRGSQDFTDSSTNLHRIPKLETPIIQQMARDYGAQKGYRDLPGGSSSDSGREASARDWARSSRSWRDAGRSWGKGPRW